jgi:MFS family permease
MPERARSRFFYGWRVVAVCFMAAVFAWGLGVFGASVYLAELTRAQGWSVALVSAAVTVFYLTNALSLWAIGGAIDRFGSRAVFIGGATALGLAVAALGQVATPAEMFAAFIVMGFGYASISLTGLSATIAPWFERHQGRSVAIALMGASIGAMLVIPLLVHTIQAFGFRVAVLGGGLLAIITLVPLAAIVLRYRRPEELGQGRDGDPVPLAARGSVRPAPPPAWTRELAIRTPALWTIAIGFAIGLTAQIGFLTHHVTLALPVLGAEGAGWLVSATGGAALAGRLLLARLADRVDVRRYTAAIMAAQAALLGLIAYAPGAATLITASLAYGFCLGQITTLSPIVVRREFGAQSYGAIYGLAATVIQFSSAFGPGLYGLLRDHFGGYGPVLAIAALAELAAMATLLAVRPAGAVSPRAPTSRGAPPGAA